MASALGHDFVGFLAVFGRHNIRPPHFASKVSYSAGAAITRPKEIRLIRCYAVRAQHHLSLSRLRGRTKKIGHPNGVPDSSLQINDIGDDLVPQSFANALMV